MEHSAQVGTNLNLINYAKWSTRICTDACEHGLGGWNTETGVCWRLILPPWMLGRYHIIFLEFLAAWIGIWIKILTSDEKHQRILCLTDSSSALGWLYKANFCPDSQKHNGIIARKLAEAMMEKEAALYSQHIKGSSNTIADSLSRDHSISTKKLTFALNGIHKSQVPQGLKMLEPVPDEITSFLASFKDGETKSSASQAAQTPSKLEALLASDDSWEAVVSKTLSLMGSTPKASSSSCPLSRAAYEEMKTAKQNWVSCLGSPFAPPFLMNARPSGRTFRGIRS